VSEPSRVLIVEDHQVVADDSPPSSTTSPDISVVGTGSLGGGLDPRTQELKPDVVLVDFRLTDGKPAADAGAGIRQVRPDTS